MRRRMVEVASVVVTVEQVAMDMVRSDRHSQRNPFREHIPTALSQALHRHTFRWIDSSCFGQGMCSSKRTLLQRVIRAHASSEQQRKR